MREISQMLITRIQMTKEYTCKIKVCGKVQGVGFRLWVKSITISYNRKGWVKNCEDGTVEILMSGLKENIEKIMKMCSAGSSASVVKKIKHDYYGQFVKFENFKIYK